MTDQPSNCSTSTAELPSRRPGRRWWITARISARGICLLIILASGAWIIALLAGGKPIQVEWIAQVLLAMAALLSSAWVSFEQLLHWRRPTRNLAAAIEEVRAGRMPIDELSTIGGGIAPVVHGVQEIFADLRRQRAEYDALQREIQRRVAHRTDALERMIGGLRRQAERDALTSLLNRRALDTYLPQLIERCRADQTPLSLLMLDIDRFKQVNDTLGHAAGDALLRDVSGLIRSGIRQEDLGFRYGGDEFVIVLPGMEVQDAEYLGHRLEILMDALARTIHIPHPPSLSTGAASLTDLEHPTAAALLEQADRQLYACKQSRQSASAA